MHRVLTSKQAEEHDKEIDKWWKGLDVGMKCNIYNCFRALKPIREAREGYGRWGVKITVLLLITLLFSSCNSRWSMSRQETVAAVKECEDGGLKANIIIWAWDNKVYNVVCGEKENPNG